MNRKPKLRSMFPVFKLVLLVLQMDLDNLYKSPQPQTNRLC